MMPQETTGSQPGTDAVAQHGTTKYLRFIRIKHIEAPTGDELATAIREWFITRTETVENVDDGTSSTEDLSEDRELMELRYQVSGGVHHVLIFYAE